MQSASAIFVLDSGIGGLSILRRLIKLSPSSKYIYFADQQYFPYGDKDPLWVQDRLKTLVTFGVQNGAQAVVIACNTATVHSLDQLRKQFSIPIFGVEPVVKPLAKYASAAILATSSTAKSARTQQLQAMHMGTHLKVVGVPQLATAIEDMDQTKIIALLTMLNSQLQGIQAIGLSCTHYPLVEKTISAIFPNIIIIDPSLAVASHVISTLSPSFDSAQQAPIFLTTGDVLRLKEQISYYVGLKGELQKVNV
ncbi:MAG: aspartate/glutamate racemase family protein [bacterium]